MSTVIMHSVVSVDGFIADEKDEVGPLFDWYGNGDVPIVEGSSMKISPISAGYVQPMWASVRSMVIGRHLFDITNGWEGTPPTGDHVVVVSHRGRPAGWHPEASYFFIDDVARAVAKARELAGDGVVAVAAGDVGRKPGDPGRPRAAPALPGQEPGLTPRLPGRAGDFLYQ